MAVVGVLASRIRQDEKLLMDAFRRRSIQFEVLDVRDLIVPLDTAPLAQDVVLNRSISHFAGLYAVHALEGRGVLAVNAAQVISTCGDKAATSLALCQAGIPIPRTSLAFSAEGALKAVEEIGYPVVIKPVTGSWGRQLARVNDRHAAEAIVEYKATHPSPQQRIYYLQEYIEKPGRDIRVIVVGNEAIAAYYRYSEHWLTNAARGARGEPCDMTSDVCRLSLQAASAVGGGILAVDLLEGSDGRLLVNEVNHTLEFTMASTTTGVDIAGHIVDHVVGLTK